MGTWTQNLMELLGILTVWLETMFTFTILTFVNTSPNLVHSFDEWMPILTGPGETLMDLLMPQSFWDAYEQAHDTLTDLLPYGNE